MSLVNIPIPSADYTAEVEYEQMTIRLKRNGVIQQVCHVSGCEIGRCCIKDQHSPSNEFNPGVIRALNEVLKKHNFKSFAHDREQADGSFITRTIRVR